MELVVLCQRFDSIVDLVGLDGGIDKNAEVIYDEPDDLNSVFLGEGVPDQGELIDVAEHEDGEIGGDGAGLIVVINILLESVLESGEDVPRIWSAGLMGWADWMWGHVRFEDEGNDGLGGGGRKKGPGPLGVGDVHSALLPRDGRELGREAFAVVVAAWLDGRVGLMRLWGIVVVMVQWLASEEGCACLVVRNFGGRRSRRTAGLGWVEWVGGRCQRGRVVVFALGWARL